MAVCDMEKGHISTGCSRREVDFGYFGKKNLLLTCNNGAKFWWRGGPVFLFSIHSISPFTIHRSPIHLLQKDMICLKEVTAIDARLFTIVVDKDLNEG